MSRNPPAHYRRLTLDRYLGEILILGGLAELIPLKQRGRFATRLGLGVLIFSLIGWLGFPWRGIVLSLILALAVETLDYTWRLGGAPSAALRRPTLWGRMRDAFYWPLAAGVLLGTWSFGEVTLIEGLIRSAFQWLCFRTIEDMVKHPERYGSVEQFRSWLRQSQGRIADALQVWVKYAIVGTLLALVLNLSSQQVWEVVGRVAWNRILIFGGGLYLLAILTFRRLSKSALRAAVQEALERWEGVRPSDLKRVLRSVPSIPGVFYAGSRPAELVEARLEWKNEDNLAARVGQRLTATLAVRYQWNMLLSSALTLILVSLLIGLSAFVIIPRDVMTRWVSTDIVEGPGPVLALDELTGAGAQVFWQRLAEVEDGALAREPLPKLAFLEAVIIVALIMFETAAGQLKADLAPPELRRWLVLGTTYLALLENEFQYLYTGYMTRRLAGAKALRFVSIRNDVLLVPSARQRLGVFRAIADFLRVYELDEGGAHPAALGIFDDYALAQEWASKFLHFSPLIGERPYDLERGLFLDTSTLPGHYWIWSNNRLLALSSFDEARWYARLVALNNHINGGKGYRAR
jgi:hypothetical protein